MSMIISMFGNGACLSFASDMWRRPSASSARIARYVVRTLLAATVIVVGACGDSGSGTPASADSTSASSAAANSVYAGPTSGAAAAPNFRSLTLADLPNLQPGYILGNATASATAPGAVMGTCTPAQMTSTNTAAQNVDAYLTAARIALKATFGNVCVPPGILPFATVTLTQEFNGLHTIGALPIQSSDQIQPSLGYTLTGGTILQGSGSGSGPAFTYAGSGGPAANWASRLLQNVSFENLGFDSWDREFLFGGTNVQGVAYSKFNNLYGTHIGVRAFDFINCVSLWVDNLYGYFSGSGLRLADDLDNSVYGSTTNSYLGNLQFTLTGYAAEGIVLEATAIGATGSQLNEILGGYWFVERPAVVAHPQAVAMTANSPNIGTLDNTYLPVGMPVGFTTSANGFVAGQTYFVVSSTATNVEVANTYGGPAVNATANSAITIQSIGGENIAIRGLGAENLPNAGTVSNVHVLQIDSENGSGNSIFLQGVAGGEIVLGETVGSNVIAGVAMRGVNGMTITNAGSQNPTRDSDGYGNEDNYWYGSYTGPDVQPYGFLGQGKDVSSNYFRTALAPTSDGAASPGLSVRGTSGSYLYSDLGIGQPYHVSGAADSTLFPNQSGIFAYAGSGGTCTLPAITNASFGTSLVGLPYWFTNVGTGACTITTQGGQSFSGLAGVTTMTVPVGGTVGLSAEPDLSGSFTWHVLSYVQPSQVQYGSIALPTTTVATLPPCVAAQKGLLYSVSDATSPTYNGPVTGGGAATIPVFCNGTTWTAH